MKSGDTDKVSGVIRRANALLDQLSIFFFFYKHPPPPKIPPFPPHAPLPFSHPTPSPPRRAAHGAISLGEHRDAPPPYRRAGGDRFVRDAHHAGPARRIDMRKLHFSSASSSASTAVTSCGFTFPCANSRASSVWAIASTALAVSPPARACALSCSSSPSSIAVNPPRAWNGVWRSANP